MITPEYNHKHITLICPECKSDDILIDEFHQETYCTKCGLVLQDNTIFKVTQTIHDEEYKVKFIRDLWRKKRKD